MSSELQKVLRRIKPEKRTQALSPRPKSKLMFASRLHELPRKLLYDTTVYIDVLQDRFPAECEVVLRAAEAWHSSVTDAELAGQCGFLDPEDDRTAAAIEAIAEAINRRPAHRTVAPDRDIWIEAAVLTGVLARTQKLARTERRRLLNDALIFGTARKHGLTVLTRNVLDFDLLQQMEPGVGVVFYERHS